MSLTFEHLEKSHTRLKPFIVETPLRTYPELNTHLGFGIKVWLKHENHQPTGAFKVRNILSAVTALPKGTLERGLICASRGNHGLGLALAGHSLGFRAVVCVPHGNNPAKNSAMRAYGAELIEIGEDFDAAIEHAKKLEFEKGYHLISSSNDVEVVAGAGTITLEMIQQNKNLNSIIYGVGGGSQCAGGIIAVRKLNPSIQLFGAQAEGANAHFLSWHSKKRVEVSKAQTFADGLATRKTYALTFPPMLETLKNFFSVSDKEIAEALRLLMRTTHQMLEGAAAVGLAAIMKHREQFQGQEVGLILSGGNIDEETLKLVLDRRI